MRATHTRGIGCEKGLWREWREVAVRSLVGQDFDSPPPALCNQWSPWTLWFSSMQPPGAQQRHGGNRVEPEDVGLRWKEGVRRIKSYRTCLTLPSWRREQPSQKPQAGGRRLVCVFGWARSLRLFLPFSPYALPCPLRLFTQVGGE